MFSTTAYAPYDRSYTPRKSIHVPSSEHRSGFTRVIGIQPTVAVEYNQHMGEVDTANQLRQARTIYRPSQLKWNKSVIDYLIDVAHTNAFLVWEQNQDDLDSGRRAREVFITQLKAGLRQVPDIIHQSNELLKKRRCGWRGCTTRPQAHRLVLAERDGNAAPVRRSHTTGYCETCMEVLCTTKSCWDDYHRDKQVPYTSTRPT